MLRLSVLVTTLALVAMLGHGLASAQNATPAATPRQVAPIAVQVELNDFSVTPDTSAFIAGQPYRFHIHNAGAATHEFIVEAAGAVDAPLDLADGEAEVEDIAPGETKELLWTFANPGAFQLACHVPGHYEAGMRSEIVVAPRHTEVVQVEIGDFYLKTDSTALRQGTTYLFAVTNTGSTPHEFILEPDGAVDKPLEATVGGQSQEAEVEDIAPNVTKSLVWTFSEDGTYQMACHVPGHYEAGMRTAFDVAPYGWAAGDEGRGS